MIDLNGNTTYTAEDLKSRWQARLAAQGLGLAERLANLERMVYTLSGFYKPSAIEQAQMQAIGTMLQAAEAEWQQEVSDNALLIATLEYEVAQKRLALPALLVADYPPVDNGQGGTIENPAITNDKEQRTAAQAIITAAPITVTALVAQRATSKTLV